MDNLLQKLLIGGSTAALAAMVPASAALAQDADIEQVVVSASRITIAGYSQPTPVTVVGTAQLERDAFSNIADAVRNLPQVSSPPASYSTSQSQASQGTSGTNFVNLRNLGFTRTLVLFDSQRVPTATVQGGVDVTTLPATVISRVDIVTGGASASWGSDAIAGVANFVINKNINGLKGTIEGGDTATGHIRDFFAETAWGEDIFGGRGHIEFAANGHIRPDLELLTDANWYKGAYWVSNSAFAPGNGQPQLVVAYNVALPNATPGGIIISSPAGTAGPGVTPAAANALRGIDFVAGGTPQLVNFGNITQGALSNGGSLTNRDTQSNFAPIDQPSNTYSFFGYGRYKLTDTIQASVQMNYGYFTGKGSTPASPQFALVIKSDNAFIPASVRAVMQTGGITSFTLGTLASNNYDTTSGTGANFYSRVGASLAPGITYNRRNMLRGVFTLDGTIGNDWSWTAYIQHGASRFSMQVLGLPIVANMTAAADAVTVTTANRGTTGLPLGSIACRSTLQGVGVVNVNTTSQTGCVPLDVFGTGVASPAAIAYATGTASGSNDVDHMSLQQDVAEGAMQGTLPWELPAGKVAVAFGMGYRKEAGFSFTTMIAQQNGYGQGNGTTMPPSQYNVLEGFGEIDAPILKNTIVNSLDVTAAGRMTSYSTSGLVETWKLGATSQVNEDIKLRTTWSVDIRAPQLSDLFSTGSSGGSQLQDPKTNIVGAVINKNPGNINLLPETARTISGGVVLTPTFIPGLSLSADWYSISITKEITTIAAATILNQCNATQASIIHPGQNGNPNDPLCSVLIFSGPNGALSQIINGEINFANQTTSGLDLSANYDMDFWDGILSWSALASLNDENTVTNPGVGTNDSAGSALVGPKWRGIISATYNTGPYSVTATSRWFGTAVQYQNGNTGNQSTAANALLYDPAHFEVPFTAYLDLRASYKWNDNLTFFGAIDNAINTPPPLVAPLTSNLQPGNVAFFDTNTAIYDLLGRNFRLGVRFNY